jgi:putative NADPH-quinone reductase
MMEAGMKKAMFVSAERMGGSMISEITLIAADTLASTGVQVNTTVLADWRAPLSSPVSTFDAGEQAANVIASDLLVLVFPMIWCAPPASMKHWIDVVFSAASQCDGQPMSDRGCMAGRSAIVVATLEDTGAIQHYDTVKTAMCDMLRPLMSGTLEYLGFTVLRPHFITGTEPAFGQDRESLSNDVAEVFANIRRRANFNGFLKPATHPLPLSMS